MLKIIGINDSGKR